MSLTGGQLDSFSLLARALGILDSSDSPNTAWFGDPVGNSTNLHGLRTILGDDGQRDALVAFVDQALGPPDREQIDGAVWVPLFSETSPNVSIFVVIKPVAGAVHLGIGVEHKTTGAAPTVATRIHVPVFQLARGSAPAPTSAGDLPGWLLIGRPGGRIDASVDVTLRDDAPAAGQPSLGGVAVALAIPTAAGDELSISLVLRDLQLPGAAAPRTFTMDAASLDQLGADVLQLVVGLVRAQADAIDATVSALRPFAGLTGMLGLRTVADLPPLPLDQLPTAGVRAVVSWFEQVLGTTTARDAWLGQLALLLGAGATVSAAAGGVSVPIGPARLIFGVRVETGTAGHPILTPWAEVAFATGAGAQVLVTADLLRADTGAGAVTALPDFRAEAVFGADAGGGDLLTGTPHVGSLHVGIGLAATRRPTFLLTLHDVTVAAGRHHDLLDLSSPQAALDAASSIVDDALSAALGNLGPAGDLVAQIIGTAPPGGLAALDVAALLANPIAAVASYWQRLIGTAPAMAQVLGAFRSLVMGGVATDAPGSGTALAPWRVDFADGAGLRLWLDAGELVVDVGASATTPVFDGFEVATEVAMTLLRAGFAPAHAQVGISARAAASLRRSDHAPAQLDLGEIVQIEASALGVAVTWSPARGLAAALQGDGLAVVVNAGSAASRIAVPLPTFDSGGHLTLTAPPWDDIEAALAALLGRLSVPVVDAAVALLGWGGRGPRLHLAGLLGDHPELEIEAWLADELLDCARLGAALSPVAALFSGFSVMRPFGAGSARSPYRCPVAGAARAPGLAAWLVPGCPPRGDDFARPLSGFLPDVPPTPAALAAALEIAAQSLPDVADLLVGRPSLADGLQGLFDRWTDTDGVLGAPTALPDGVTPLVLDGLSYDELVALGGHGQLLNDVFDVVPTAVVHVGCEETWGTGRAAGTAFDTTVDGAGTIPATGAGTWFVRLPAPGAAAAARPDRGAVGEQAARLGAVLGGRTDPIAVVAYGASGAAALRAAASVNVVSDVATVGTPWAGLSVDSLRTGLSGDALVLLQRLVRPDAAAWPDSLLAVESSPLQVMRLIVVRCAALLGDPSPTPLPPANGEALRGGLGVRAVFGALDADAIATGVGALIADGITARLEAAQAAAPPNAPHTELHAGVDLPVIDVNLGGLLVGLGATVELAALIRADDGTISASVARGLLIELHLGVEDGWLVGGPGASQPDADLRWLSLHLEIPFDGRPGDAEITLHEARAFSAYRESWVVRADGDGGAATTALPEVRVMLSGAIARLGAASPDLLHLLELAGLARSGGLDPDGLDRLIHDPKSTMLSAGAAAPADLAATLRALVPSATGTGTSIAWQVGPATLGVDLGAGTFSATVQAAEPGLPPITASVSLASSGATSTASAEVAIGALDAHAGGLRLVARAGASNDLALEWQAPGAATRRLALLPSFDAAAVTPLLTVLVPSALAQGLASYCRDNAGAAGRAALDAALDVLGLLDAADARGVRAMRLPIALFDAPAAYLRGAVAAWASDPVTSATTLLDALAPIVVPNRPPGQTGWPVAPGVTIDYGADAGVLRLAVDVALSAQVGGATVTTTLVGGLRVAPSSPPTPVLAAAVSVDGRGVSVTLEPQLRVSLLRPTPATPLEIFPNGPGLGSALAAAGGMVLPPVLNALAGHRNDAGASLLKDVGAAVFDLGGALDLVDGGAFTDARLSAFAADPAARLQARIPQLVVGGAAALARALDPTAAVVHVSGPTAGVLTLGFGATQAVKLALDSQAATPALVLSAAADLPGVGRVTLEALRLSADGVQVSARFGPAALSAGPLVLWPMVVVRAGVTAGTFTRMLGLDLALDSTGATAVEFRWNLDATPPALVVVSRATDGTETVDATPGQVAAKLLALGASLATSVVVDALGPTLPDVAKTTLRGVVFTDAPGSTTVDAGLFTDLFHPLALVTRLERLLWNAATGPAPLSITIDNKVTIGLAAEATTGGGQRLGLNLSLAAGQRYAIATGDPEVDLEIDASWVDPAVPAGLSIFVLEGSIDGGGAFTFALSPDVAIAGIGLRFAKTSGPLLDLGPVSIDAIAVHLYGEAGDGGLGGGVQIELDGLALSPGGGGGSNGVANGILNDAGASGKSNRPSFSPAIAVQHHPGQSGASVSLRAGRPPGPWWFVVQRQLGPIYIEQIGFDSVEHDGQVTRISLLFDGRVSLFGLTASVDELSMSWVGGDVTSLSSWAVDLQGLAVAADMAGVSLTGGLLKSTSGDGQISYVGMLMGRFAAYGLSVFGGYTNDNGSPSFFVFGGINGPIGGPPAFFVTGIGGGLGINRGLRVPDDLSHFNEYPFIQALDPAAKPPADPMAELRKLNDYFPPQRGNFWFAAGISFNCFTLVDGVAVIAVSFGDGLDIDLFGLARMALPRPQAALVSIELGLLARFSTSEGIFSIRAQLTENSWLLYPEVRLTGGFAFVIWWKGPNKGQFVLTLGGYHPSFHRDGYPDVPRLGLVWQVTDQIVIKGGSYFALTSEALMAGVGVEVSADFGFAWAKVTFDANGIVYFDPFWFEVGVLATMSAGIKIDTFLGTISLSLTLGVGVTVRGPDFSGEATLEVGPVTVTVPFGSERQVAPRVLAWGEFVSKYLEDAGGAARALSSITGRGALPSATGGQVAAPTADGSADRPFEVFAEFELSIITTVPTSAFDLGLAGGPVNVPVVRSDGATATLGLKPMLAGSLSSTVQLTLESTADGTNYVSEAGRLQLLGANLAAAAPRAAGSSLSTDAFPIGAWGAPDVPDPTSSQKPLPKGDVLFAGSSLRLVAEAKLDNRGPEIDYYGVVAARRPMPLQASGSARNDLLARAAEVSIVEVTTAQQALAAASDVLFRLEAAGAPPAGVLVRGAYSNLARATFAGDRAAPPMFGSLADGLAVNNAADGASTQQAAAAPPAFAGTRPPVVSALLTAGAGVATRAPTTTVNDARIKRRAAPTLASVQARTALHLPVKLAVTALPAGAQGGTVVATGGVPRTEAPGAARSYAPGLVGGVRGLDGVVGGLGTARQVRSAILRPRDAAAAAGAPIAAGDLVVMTLPDASVDTAADARPALAIAGTARVTMLNGDRSVALDAVVEGDVVVPPGVALIGVQAGTPADPAGDVGGMAGWHAASRIASLGSHAALGNGCVVTLDAAGAGVGVRWTPAAEVVAGAAAIVTRFAQPANTVVVVLADADPRHVDGLELELFGGQRVLGPNGRPLPPIVVLRGAEAALVYAVEPGAQRPLAVRVRSGGDWRLAGVLAGGAAPKTVARLLADRGALAVVGRLLASSGAGCSVSWRAPGAPVPTVAPGRRAARTTTTATPPPAKPRQAGRKKQPRPARKSAPKRRSRRGG